MTREPRHHRKKMPAPPRVRVRCLGPGDEHTFLSTGPGNRVCDACRRGLRQLVVSPRAVPLKDHHGGIEP